MTTVFSGPPTISSAFTGPASGPKDFDVAITFTTPFLYSVAAGNLLFDFRNLGTTNLIAAGDIYLDAINAVGDGTSRVFGGGAARDALGSVTRFETASVPAAVPEPTSLLLFATGGVGLIAKLRRRKKQI